MSIVTIEDTNLTNIANAIRSKNGTSDTYKPSEMASAIEDIQTGIEPTGTLDITENGTYDVTDYASANVNVAGGGGETIEKGIIINSFDEEGYATDVSVVGMTSIPSYYFDYAFNNNTWGKKIGSNLHLPNNLEQIRDYAFNECNSLAINELPDSVTFIGKNAFYQCEKLALSKLPPLLTGLENFVFAFCSNLTVKEIPVGVTVIGQQAFRYCTGLTELVLKGNITEMRADAFSSTNLARVVFPNVTAVPTIPDDDVFAGTPISSGNGYILVPKKLVSEFQMASYWSTYANQIVSIDINSIEIVCQDKLNIYGGNKNLTIQKITYNGGFDDLYYKEQESYVLSINGNATIDENGLITLNDNAKLGDKLIITAVSTYDTSIIATKEIEIVYIEPCYEINLNDGQWVDSGETVDGNIVYKSDAGSYHTNNGKSIATITVTGYTKLNLYIRSYAESNYDYTEAFEIDTPATRGAGKFTTKGKQSASNYIECIYELDGGIHTIDIMYSKDSSGDNNDDRGYFYVGEVS